MQEREILYKLLFDMKGDLNDLKSLVYGLIQNNDLQVPANANTSSMRGLRALSPGSTDTSVYPPDHSRYPDPETQTQHQEDREHSHPIILGTQKQQEVYDDMEEVEENLSLEDHEKDLISKALKKHNGRRKEAAKDLGISERTLYRKIKQYEL
jgi:DNA-binding NtrC family response regulator